MGKRERLKSRRERAKQQLCTYITLFFIHVQLFRERSNKVHATIPKGIAGDFEFTVLYIFAVPTQQGHKMTTFENVNAINFTPSV